MPQFIELHYNTSGDAFILNISAISRVYTTKTKGETRVALLEDKNISDEIPTECSRQAVYRVKETYAQIKALLLRATSRPIINVDCLEGELPKL